MGAACLQVVTQRCGHLRWRGHRHRLRITTSSTSAIVHFCRLCHEHVPKRKTRVIVVVEKLNAPARPTGRDVDRRGSTRPTMRLAPSSTALTTLIVICVVEQQAKSNVSSASWSTVVAVRWYCYL